MFLKNKQGTQARGVLTKDLVYSTWNTSNDSVTVFLSSKTCRLKLSHHWLVQNVFAAARQCIVNRQSLRYRSWALEFVVVFFFFPVCVSNILILWAHINIYIFVLKNGQDDWNVPHSQWHNNLFFLFKKKNWTEDLSVGCCHRAYQRWWTPMKMHNFRSEKQEKVSRNLRKCLEGKKNISNK